jgi:hypothetical protein
MTVMNRCCVVAGYSTVSTAMDLSVPIVAYNFMTSLLNIHIAKPSLCELLACLSSPLLVVLLVAAHPSVNPRTSLVAVMLFHFYSRYSSC